MDAPPEHAPPEHARPERTGPEADPAGTNALRPLRFGFVLVPGFSLVALSCAVEVLRAARLEAPAAGFGWTLLTPNGAQGPVASSSGIALAAEAWRDLGRKERPETGNSVGDGDTRGGGWDALAVCGGERTHAFRDRALEAALRDAARAGAMIGSISDGAFLVAATGLFDRARSTIHWKCQSAYRERHPRLDVRASLLEIDGARFSCAGGTASLDLMLRLVARTLGLEAAGRIADNYVHERLRGDDQMQHVSHGFRVAARSRALGHALGAMEAHMERPLSIDELARRAATSPRQLDRLFRRHLGAAPSAHYRDLRLARASGLLRQSDLAVSEIALSCGFNSASHLARHFRTRFGTSPVRYRNEGGGYRNEDGGYRNEGGGGRHPVR